MNKKNDRSVNCAPDCSGNLFENKALVQPKMHSDRQEARAFAYAALCFDEKNWSVKPDLARKKKPKLKSSGHFESMISKN
jgi:hypothetical protein